MAALSLLGSERRSCLTRAKLSEGRRGASDVVGTPPLGVGGGRAMDARSSDVACSEVGGEGRGEANHTMAGPFTMLVAPP